MSHREQPQVSGPTLSNAEIADQLASLAQLLSLNAREAVRAGVKVAISTDAHSTREFGNARHGVDQARRAGMSKESVLNCLPWQELCSLLKR